MGRRAAEFQRPCGLENRVGSQLRRRHHGEPAEAAATVDKNGRREKIMKTMGSIHEI